MTRATAPRAPRFRRARRRALAAASAPGAAALALAAAAWAFRDVPRYAGPETFWALKGELEEARAELVTASETERGYAVRLQSTRGWSVDGYLRVPRNPDPGRPTVVVLGGIGTGRRAAELVRTREPHVVVGLDYPWTGPRRPNLLHIARRLPDIRRAVLLTPAALLLAADYLAGHAPTTDGADGPGLIAIGASFGAPFALAAAAADPRYDTALLIHGGGDLRRLVRWNLHRRYPHAPLWLADIGARVLEPVEPTDHAPRLAPRPLILVNGLHDDRIPAECVSALYAAAREPKTLVWLPTPHIRPHDDALLQATAEAAVRVLDAVRARTETHEPTPADGESADADRDTADARPPGGVARRERRP
jgi:dienelactone hydrolase